MSALDELRARLWELAMVNEAPLLHIKDDIMPVLDAFAAAHPGLVDYTVVCNTCGLATNGGSSSWHNVPPDWKVGYFNGFDRPLAARCPACAKEA